MKHVDLLLYLLGHLYHGVLIAPAEWWYHDLHGIDSTPYIGAVYEGVSCYWGHTLAAFICRGVLKEEIILIANLCNFAKKDYILLVLTGFYIYICELFCSKRKILEQGYS